MADNTLGFIILRHVNSEETNKYWMTCYDCIRKFYPENIVLIVDDNSNREFLTEKKLHRAVIVNSEYPKRAELLPYYYYLKYKLFDCAVILHDSVFINKYIDFTVNKYKLIWDFEHHWDQIEDETRMIKAFDDAELLHFYQNKSLWRGCFGGMSIITYDFLAHVNSKYDLSKLLDFVLTRYNRCSFERVIACLLQKEHSREILLGDINGYSRWGIRYSERDQYKFLPLLKVWTGR